MSELAVTKIDPVAVALDAGVTGGEAERSTLVGGVPIQLGVSVTAELKPYSELTETGIDTFCPNCKDTDGVELIEKSAVTDAEVVVACAATVTIVNVAEPTSSIGLPVAVIAYELEVTFATS